ncbi:MAG: hypothetical protein ABJG78_01095 [Cyclobacteriaceae bacterium]
MLHTKIVLLIFFALLGINLISAAIRAEDWLKLGRQSITLQNFDMAVHYFSNEIRDNPKNVFAYLERAEAYRLKGEMIRSAEDKRKAYELDPDYIRKLTEVKRNQPTSRRFGQPRRYAY